MSANMVGARIKALREQLNFSQEALARQFGFKDRQTLSAIENGERKVTAEELVRASELLAEPIETFTDPFLLIGEGKFSWRQAGIAGKQLVAYEHDAGKLIAAFRVLGAELGVKPQLLRRALSLTKASSFEDAIAAGERFAEEFNLGAAPAQQLASAMEEALGILVLMVDAIPGVSGAACRLPELDAVLINRNEIPGRRHYDLAHELFHVLTWETMPPAHTEDTRVPAKERVEQLADHFASALLMPTASLAPSDDWTELPEEALIARLNGTADELGVTAVALKWRLVALGRLARARAQAIDDSMLRNNGRRAPRPLGLVEPSPEVTHLLTRQHPVRSIVFGRRRAAVPGFLEDKPPLFSKRFVARVARAIEEGRISIRRAAGLLGLTVDDLPELFASHAVAAEIGL